MLVRLFCWLHADAIIFLRSSVVNMQAQCAFLCPRKGTLSEKRNAVSCLSRRIITRACAAVRPRERGIPRRPPCLYSRLNIYRPGRLRGAAAAPPVRSRTRRRPGERRRGKSQRTFAYTGTCMGVPKLVMQQECTGKKYANL